MKVIVNWFVCLFLCASGPSHAATPVRTPQPPEAAPSKKEEKKGEKEEKKNRRWSKLVSLGSTISLGQSSSAVGKANGTTASLGATLVGRFTYLAGSHQLDTAVSLQIQQSRTPVVDAWVKTLDQFKVASSYVYRLESSPWLGFFASLSLETALFGGNDPRERPWDYVISEPNGKTTTDHGSNILLTKELSPTFVDQSAGVHFTIIEQDNAKVTLRLGLGSVEAFTRHGVVLVDVMPPTLIHLRRMEDYQQAGVEARIDAAGAFNGFVTYAFYVDVLAPFYNSIERGLSGNDLINFDVSLKLGFKLSKWASIDYVMGVRRFPLLVDVVQAWNGLMFSFAGNILD
jgi:hypothetical protein